MGYGLQSRRSLKCSVTLFLLTESLLFSAEAAGSTSALQMAVLAGQDARNSLTSRNVIVPVVRISDQSGQPVSGVRVRFELLGSPPRGFFSEESTRLEAVTDLRGEASAPGYEPRHRGALVMRVSANYQNTSVQTLIKQSNGTQPYAVASASHPFSWRRRLLLIGAGSAGLLAFLMLRSSPPTTGQITLGPPVVGGAK